MMTLCKMFGTGRSNVLSTARTTVVHYEHFSYLLLALNLVFENSYHVVLLLIFLIKGKAKLVSVVPHLICDIIAKEKKSIGLSIEVNLLICIPVKYHRML